MQETPEPPNSKRALPKLTKGGDAKLFPWCSIRSATANRATDSLQLVNKHGVLRMCVGNKHCVCSTSKCYSQTCCLIAGEAVVSRPGQLSPHKSPRSLEATMLGGLHRLSTPRKDGFLVLRAPTLNQATACFLHFFTAKLVMPGCNQCCWLCCHHNRSQQGSLWGTGTHWALAKRSAGRPASAHTPAQCPYMCWGNHRLGALYQCAALWRLHRVPVVIAVQAGP